MYDVTSKASSTVRAVVAAVAVGVAGMTGVIGGVSSAVAQPVAPTKLTVGIYAPSVEFGTAQARLAYVQGMARSIEAATGIKTEAQSFASLGALKKGGVDFAVVDGQCVATNLGWKLLASADIGGGTTRAWGLFASGASTMQALAGKRLAFIQMGCNDNGFIDNAMLDSEVTADFFSARVGKSDLTAAVAEVASYKGAQAVFAPVSAAKGLTRVFETGNVPNPGFVQLSSTVPDGIADKVQGAVTGYRAGGAIDGWAAANRGAYQSLSGQMGGVRKRGVFASPEPVRFDAKDVLIEPASLAEIGRTGLKQHFVRPPARME